MPRKKKNALDVSVNKALGQAGARELLSEHSKEIVEGLLAVARGDEVERKLSNGQIIKEKPSLSDRIKVQLALINKIAPDLKSAEVTMEATVEDTTPQLHDNRQVARAIMSILGRGAMEDPIIDLETAESEEKSVA